MNDTDQNNPLEEESTEPAEKPENSEVLREDEAVEPAGEIESTPVSPTDEVTELFEAPDLVERNLEEESSETKTEKEPPSKVKKFFKQLLTYLIIILIAFGAGFLLDHFLRYRPLAEELNTVQVALEEANEQISTLEDDKDRLLFDLNYAYDEVAELMYKLELAEAHIQYYKILVDINNARIELFMEDPEAAIGALSLTKDRLDELLPVIADFDPEIAVSLPNRLELIIAGINRDPEIAMIDLELFTKDLLILELQMFE